MCRGSEKEAALVFPVSDISTRSLAEPIIDSLRKSRKKARGFLYRATRALRLETVVNSLISGQSKKPERGTRILSKEAPEECLADRSLS